MFTATISNVVESAFEQYGIARSFGQIKPSNKPELSDFQCNGALQVAKALGRNPRAIAEEIRALLADNEIFETISVDGPGFLNFKLKDQYIIDQVAALDPEHFNQPDPQKVVIDYGGPNVAKPLHVGHLRSAIIGESIKRSARYLGHDVVADIHLGDWGTPMGMLLVELQQQHPEWPYFSKNFVASAQTATPPLSVDVLNEVYPIAAGKFNAQEKLDEQLAKAEKDGTATPELRQEIAQKIAESQAYAELARQATAELQAGHPGYRALWKHFVTLSLDSIKQDFGALDVDFDLWLGESDADPYIEGVIEDLINRKIARDSQGAVVIDVIREDDNQEIPPLMLRKSNGAVTYATTDLATIFQRAHDFSPDKILYVVDARQGLHFTQVFRAADKAGYLPEANLEHTGFGTMNGKDGKPFKTRAGGVMRLGDLIETSRALAAKESGFTETDQTPEIKEMLHAIAMAAIKFGDLSNPRTSDYVFDPEEFIRFDGKTGPYIQYAKVRSAAILEKTGGVPDSAALYPDGKFPTAHERNLALQLIGFKEAVQSAYSKRMPSELCNYVYDLAKNFNGFYKNCPVIAEDNQGLKESRLVMADLASRTIGTTLDLLAIPTPRKMLRAQTAEPASP